MALVTIADDDDQFGSVTTLLTDRVAARLGVEMSETREITELTEYQQYFDVIIDGEAYALKTLKAIIEDTYRVTYLTRYDS